ncbi:hypothetical protein SDC9_190158 [bioreactor metagenome]|uniref:Uncharacterized protein n=1 Tax=bioreactor metagenome TaxID=1076179 RepID=A0A645HU74_9ZZZZ
MEVTAIRNIASTIAPQLIPARSTKNAAKTTGTKALNKPNRTAPDILAATMVFRLIGASKRRSKERPFRSKVMVTASMDVVPNRTLIAISPGSISLMSAMSTFPVERIICISVHESGKIMPQLMLGGFR